METIFVPSYVTFVGLYGKNGKVLQAGDLRYRCYVMGGSTVGNALFRLEMLRFIGGGLDADDLPLAAGIKKPPLFCGEAVCLFELLERKNGPR
jgi:hypothetical protein